jgi:hypothetical protein
MFQEQSAIPIRNPSTANLLIDSLDRNNLASSQSTDFTITKQANILSGYFTRFGVSEIVLNYFIPNISPVYGSNTLSLTVNGVTQDVPIQSGNYTVSSVLEAILDELNVGSKQTPPNYPANLFPNIVFELNGTPGNYFLFAFDYTNPGAPVLQNYIINSNVLARMLRLPQNIQNTNFKIINPYLIPNQLRYLDFVCTNLTYQQGLKDGTTSNFTRDVLYRWNFGYSEQELLDDLGYPIHQGYLPFVSRRYLNFPKQIKWDTQQPIGQLSLQIYRADGVILRVSPNNSESTLLAFGGLEYSLGLLVSEQ